MDWKDFEDDHPETVAAAEAEQDSYSIRCAVHISGGLAIKIFVDDTQVASYGLFIVDGGIEEAKQISEEMFEKVKGRDFVTRSNPDF